MKRLIFDEEHEMFRDSVRRFMQSEVEPRVEQWREDGICDPAAFLKAGEQGLLCMWADEKYGGLGITDFRFEQVIIEETMRHGDIGLFLTLHSRLVGPYIGDLGSEDLKARLAMTEPAAGSDLAGIKSRAVLDGDHWVLNGSKTFISNGINGGAFVVAARTVPGKPHGIGLFVVEEGMEGFNRGRNLKKMGLKTQDTAELFFENVRIPVENVLGDPEGGFYSLMHHLAEERLIRPIGAFQNSRFKMAEMRTALDVTQTFVDQCVLLHNQGELSANLAAEAKLFASELESEVMDNCVQLHGGSGYMSEYRISHMFTDARVSRIYAGSSEIMKEIIARSIGLDERKLTG